MSVAKKPTKRTWRERQLRHALRMLRREYLARHIAGTRLANVCWNAARGNLLEQDKPRIAALAKDWDTIGIKAAQEAVKLLGYRP